MSAEIDHNNAKDVTFPSAFEPLNEMLKVHGCGRLKSFMRPVAQSCH
jgi:hypothetical protein